MGTIEKLIDRLSMPQSAAEALVRAVPDATVRAIVEDNRATPERGPATRIVTPVTDVERIEAWRLDDEPAFVRFDYNPFASHRLR
jgi:hypothetical protein